MTLKNHAEKHILQEHIESPITQRFNKNVIHEPHKLFKKKIIIIKLPNEGKKPIEKLEILKMRIKIRHSGAHDNANILMCSSTLVC